MWKLNKWETNKRWRYAFLIVYYWKVLDIEINEQIMNIYIYTYIYVCQTLCQVTDKILPVLIWHLFVAQ